MTHIPNLPSTGISGFDIYQGKATGSGSTAEDILTVNFNQTWRYVRGFGYMGMSWDGTNGAFHRTEFVIDCRNWGTGQSHYVRRLQCTGSQSGTLRWAANSFPGANTDVTVSSAQDPADVLLNIVTNHLWINTYTPSSYTDWNEDIIFRANSPYYDRGWTASILLMVYREV